MYIITNGYQTGYVIWAKITHGKWIYPIGRPVNDEWLKSFEIRQELYLDDYIIMPNLCTPPCMNQPDTDGRR